MATRQQWELDPPQGSNVSTKGMGQISGGRQGSQGLYEESTVQHFPLGYRLAFEDGRVFRYGQAGPAAALVAGKVVANDVTYTALGEAKVAAVVNSAGTNAMDYTSDADGIYRNQTLYLKDTDIFKSTVTDDMLAGGYLHITKNIHEAALEGHTFRIRTNDYTAATSIVKLTLMDPIDGNLGSEAEVAVTGSLYKSLVTATYAQDTVIAGVPLHAITAGSFGWIQTWGVATVLADGTIVVGSIVTLSDGVAGAVQEFGGGLNVSEIGADSDYDRFAAYPIVGFAISAGTTAQYQPVYLQIAP